jgi:hypothetical protein
MDFLNVVSSALVATLSVFTDASSAKSHFLPQQRRNKVCFRISE